MITHPCDVLPSSDGHVADAAYYIEWDQDGLQLAAFACADCTARLRAGERLTEYDRTRPVVVLIRRVEKQLELAAQARRQQP